MKYVYVALLGLIGFYSTLVQGATEIGPRCVSRRPQLMASQETSGGMLRMASASADGVGMVRKASVSESGETQLNVVDILIAFDASAANWVKFNGKGSVGEYAQSCIDKMNECLDKSKLLDTFRFRLAGTVTIAADLRGDLEDVLDRFVDAYGRDVSSGACAVVPAARDTYGADIVSVLVANGETGTVGLGYSLMDDSGFSFSSNPSLIVDFAPWAYNVCSIQAVDEDYTLAHEVGHVMGAGHPDKTCASASAFSAYEWVQASRSWKYVIGGDLGPQLYGDSSGYFLWIGDTGYYTVMGYNFGGLDANGQVNDALRFDPVPYFSSPDILFENTPVGTSVNNNRKTLLSTYKYVAQFRASKVDEEGGEPSSADAGSPSEDIEPSSVTNAGYVVKGAFSPVKALNAVAPYVGIAYSNEVPVAIVQLKIGKPNARTGISKVSGKITGIDGTKYTIRTASVSTGNSPQWAKGMVVTKFGTLDLVLGGNGFAGTCASSPFGALEIRTHNLTAGLASNPAAFRMETVDVINGIPVLTECLPTNTPITVGAKWTLAKASKVKYSKVRGTYPAKYELVIDEGSDGSRTNRSALKLTYTAKTSCFTGSFSFYLTAGTNAKPRLKKLQAKVTGFVVDGEGVGVAVVRGKGSWSVRIE